MTIQNMPPVPPAGKTAEDALAKLAGALIAALVIATVDRGDQDASLGEMILFVAHKQWLDSGFMRDEAGAIAETILLANSAAKESNE